MDGIVYHTLRVCPPFDIEAMLMQQECKHLGRPLLTLSTDYGQDDTEQLRTRIGAFLELLEAR